nr:EAL domain-containing protein [Thermomicrobiales bacterium]
IGVMFGCCSEPIAFNRRDLCLVSGLAELISHEVMKARVEKARSRHFEVLITQVQESLAIFSVDGRMLYESPAAREMLGYPDGVIESMTPDELLALIHPDDLAGTLEVRRELLANPNASRSFLHRVRHVDGSWRTIRVAASNLLDEPSVGGLVFTSRDITEQNAHDEQLQYEARHDSLTGLLNRATIERHLHGLLADPRVPVAFVYIDIDDFKLVNDTFGHFAGDEVLRVVSRRMDAFVREGELVGRFGGDEFVMLIPDVSYECAQGRAEELADVLQRPMRLQGSDVVAICSIGVARATEHGTDLDTLFRAADAALYRVKSSGGGSVAMYATSLDNAIHERHAIDHEFTLALERDELVLEYQSIVELESGEVIGMEALVRWNHPTRGRLMPMSFVPILEELGIAGRLGRWVLDRAARQVKRGGVSVNVNVSPQHLREPTFMRDVLAAIETHGIDASALVLEITETASILHDSVGMTVLSRLKDLGVTFAIDDFGTGYSGLSALRNYPVQMMKLDRVFLERLESDLRDQEIVRAVINVAKALGIAVVVEGIESMTQA